MDLFSIADSQHGVGLADLVIFENYFHLINHKGGFYTEYERKRDKALRRPLNSFQK